jgi:3-hydroxyacyl-[acyl-carrier-protein] dehydratase
VTTHLDRADIEAILPHRAPFLFVDTVLEIEDGKHIVGELHVNEDIRFLSRRDDGVFLPATMLAEAMAQVGAILALHPEENRGRTIYFRAIEGAEFQDPVALGQTVRIEAEVRKMRARFGVLSVTAYVDDAVAAKAVMSFALG